MLIEELSPHDNYEVFDEEDEEEDEKSEKE